MPPEYAPQQCFSTLTDSLSRKSSPAPASRLVEKFALIPLTKQDHGQRSPHLQYRWPPLASGLLSICPRTEEKKMITMATQIRTLEGYQREEQRPTQVVGGASQDVANPALIRPRMAYLISLLSGLVIHLVAPFPILPVTLLPLLRRLEFLSWRLPSRCTLTRLQNSGQLARPYPPERPPQRSFEQARIASVGIQSIWRSPCSNLVSQCGSTAYGCWLHSSGQWR